MRKLLLPISILLIAVLQFSSCSVPPNTGKTSKLVIVCSFYPIYISVLNLTIGISDVSVSLMTPPQTGCLHDYSLTASDLKTLERAKVFVVNGAGMESFMDKVTLQYPNLSLIDASKNIQLLKDPHTGEDNPHIWVSVSGCLLQLDNMMKGLIAVDPIRASLYQKNGEIYRKKLETLREKMLASLKNIKTKDIVTFHEAFPYFASEFSLRIAAVVQREPGAEPSPKELISLIQMIKKLPTKVLFVEPQYPGKSAEVIARETGASVYTLDPVVSGDGAPTSYLDIMELNLQTLVKALS